jgi:arginyl-tRNA synthetase
MILDELNRICAAATFELFGQRCDDVPIEFPEEASFGDLAVNGFHLARALRRPPQEIAARLAARLAGQGPIAKAEAASGYVNLTIERPALFAAAVPPALADAAAVGAGRSRAGRRILVEFSAPNTNKPQHLGHLRNNFLGDSVARILENAGAQASRVNLVNDRGIHICKSMLAYERWGGGVTPASTGRKGDHLVGDFYVRFETEFQKQVDGWVAGHEDDFRAWFAAHATDRKGTPRPEADVRKEWRATFKEESFGRIPLGRAAQEMLLRWESGDPATVTLWRTMNGWVFDGFDRTYRRLGIAFDKVYLESETWKLGKDLILEALARGVFERRTDGAVDIDLSKWGLGRKVVLRPDGTSVYITQDVGTTILKVRDFGADELVWVVADEQRHHFKVLFKVLELMGYPWAAACRHLAYGLVNLPEGRMKSREGTVVDADDLLDEVAGLAREEIVSRDPAVPKDVLEGRAEKIALAALRFMLLKVNPVNTMVYDPKESVSFDGETGPYLLYTAARIQRMLDDGAVRRDDPSGFDPAALGEPSEVALARKLLQFPRAAERAAAEMSPAVVCKYLHELAQAYNTYYQDVPVLRAEIPAVRRARLQLSAATRNVLTRGCALLGIEMIERM